MIYKCVSFGLRRFSSTMLTFILFLSLSLAIAAANPLVSNPSNGVTYEGTSSNGVEEFQNIFFAKPPTGHRRFAPPEAYTPPKNTRVNATVPSAACPQPRDPVPKVGLFSNITNMSEDCLSLRIMRATNTSGNANLPVMVWIYGGQCYISSLRQLRLLMLLGSRW